MNSVYFLAEIGVNHEGSHDLALEMIKTASLAGANGVKFQCYRAETLAAKDSPSYWDRGKEPEKTQYSLFKKHEHAELDFYKPLIDSCKKYNLDFVVTCFDKNLIDIFNPFVKFHKISSSDITNFPLIEKIIEKDKPIVLSTGASSLEEIENTVAFIRQRTSQELTILHCVLNYPCDYRNSNINMLNTLNENLEKYNINLGYSCHVPMPEGLDCLISAIENGANFIEKHYSTSRIKNGNDHYHAMTAEDLYQFRLKEKVLNEIKGNGVPNLKIQDSARKNARRGVYAAKDIKKNELINQEHIALLRPANEIDPRNIDELIGKKAILDIDEGISLKLKFFK